MGGSSRGEELRTEVDVRLGDEPGLVVGVEGEGVGDQLLHRHRHRLHVHRLHAGRRTEAGVEHNVRGMGGVRCCDGYNNNNNNNDGIISAE